MSTVSRRRFLSAAACGASFTVMPRHVVAGAAGAAPSDRVNTAFIGAGTQGIRQLIDALPRNDIRIATVCDPNRRSDDYVEWGKNEIRDKIRRFLGDDSWGADAKGCRCGREVGVELVERHYAKAGLNWKCPAYSDFREMLANEKSLDAVYNMTPDHLHGTVLITAMRQGKHAITHKPVANVFSESYLAMTTARERGVATHLFCAADRHSTPLMAEWIQAGAIGQVREVHNWSIRPFWPQGMLERPREAQPVPDGMEWDLWLGPIPPRPYNLAYTHAVFRGWIDFGSGALGDMGHYSFSQIFKILKLGAPATVEAGRDQFWAIVDGLWKKQENTVSYPRASAIHWEFPARGDMGPVSLYWYDGGMKPPVPAELEEDGKELPEEGMLFVGTEGTLLADFTGENPRLIPEKKMRAFKKPPETLPRPLPELDQWLKSCRGGGATEASFERAWPWSQTIMLGNIALRINKKLAWDAEARRFKNSPEANALLTRAYRPGWEL
jgi:predicted dehydrogenase